MRACVHAVSAQHEVQRQQSAPLTVDAPTGPQRSVLGLVVARGSEPCTGVSPFCGVQPALEAQAVNEVSNVLKALWEGDGVRLHVASGSAVEEHPAVAAARGRGCR